VADAVAGERLHPRGDDRAVANVQGLGSQGGGHADIQIVQPALAARDGREGLKEAGLPAHHLQDQLADVDAGHHALRALAEVDEAWGVRGGGQRRGVESSLSVHAGLDVGIQPAGDVPQGGIEVARLLLEKTLRVLEQLQSAQHRALGSFPGLAGQELRPGVGPTGGDRSEDVPALQALVELLQDAEDIAGAIHGALRPPRREYDPPPGGRNHASRHPVGVEMPGGHTAGRPGLHELGQRKQGLQDRSRLGRGPELDGGAELGQELPHHPVALHQGSPPLRVRILVRAGYHLGDVVDCRPEIATGHDGFDGLPDRLQAHGRF